MELIKKKFIVNCILFCDIRAKIRSKAIKKKIRYFAITIVKLGTGEL
jgi:hypothetical protein